MWVMGFSRLLLGRVVVLPPAAGVKGGLEEVCGRVEARHRASIARDGSPLCGRVGLVRKGSQLVCASQLILVQGLMGEASVVPGGVGRTENGRGMDEWRVRGGLTVRRVRLGSVLKWMVCGQWCCS